MEAPASDGWGSIRRAGIIEVVTDRSFVPHRIAVVPVLAALLLVSACSNATGTLQEGARQEELAPALLTEDQVRGASAAPDGLESVAPERANLSDDPDPRGPCGAVVEALPVLDGAVAVFGQDDIVVVNVVLVDTGGLAERLVGATIADLVAGCPAFTKEDTPFDEPQLTELIADIDLGGAGEQSVAFQARGTVGDNDPVYGVEALVRVGDDLTAIVILATEAVPEQFVQDLASAAAERLTAFRSG